MHAQLCAHRVCARCDRAMLLLHSRFNAAATPRDSRARLHIIVQGRLILSPSLYSPSLLRNAEQQLPNKRVKGDTADLTGIVQTP
jgi:hypothetical protein